MSKSDVRYTLGPLVPQEESQYGEAVPSDYYIELGLRVMYDDKLKSAAVEISYVDNTCDYMGIDIFPLNLDKARELLSSISSTYDLTEDDSTFHDIGVGFYHPNKEIEGIILITEEYYSYQPWICL